MKIESSTAGAWPRVVTMVALTTALAIVPFQSARSGGPPLVTDDPETPGDGNWEINFATITAQTASGREFTAPDLDINYGWGERIQLKADISWLAVRPSGQGTKSGLNISDFGVKWREANRATLSNTGQRSANSSSPATIIQPRSSESKSTSLTVG